MPLTSPSVLLIRLDGIGDALALCPLVAALRERGIPVDAVLTQHNFDAFASGALRERFLAPFAVRDNSRANRDAIADFGRTLRERGYSHALVATEDTGGYHLARASHAAQRVGFANGWSKPFKTLWIRSLLTQTLYRAAALDARAPHECVVLFELGRTLLGPDAQATRDIALLWPLVVPDIPVRDGRIGFQVTDKWDRLGIFFDDVVACARTFDRDRIRPFGSIREADYTKRFQRATGLSVEIFDALPPWKSAIANSSALVAPDGGAMNVAGMVGTPTVAVFPSQRDFTLQTARWSPWAAPYTIVEARAGWAREAATAAIALTNGVAAADTAR
jgi:ADP-heptose:LPS heptosyltransferase